jgi:hypothetical protein
MIANKKVIDFKNKSDEGLKRFYAKNPSSKRFSPPGFADSAAQERMMRIGVEARALQANTADEFYAIALATLQDDYIRHRNEDMAIVRRGSDD